MIRMVHFATPKDMLPLLRMYNVDPDVRWTWMRAPVWVRKMWDVARREQQRQRDLRLPEPLQYWRWPLLSLKQIKFD